MDYQTLPISREEIRILAKELREKFGYKDEFYFDVLQVLERIDSVFPNVTYCIIENDDESIIKDFNIPCAFMPFDDFNQVIYIREKVYEGAAKNVGGYRDHITHEIAHAFLFQKGYRPILTRTFNDGEIEPYYISVEWQAKALAGEIMIPYEKTTGMNVKEIVELCVVSEDCANYRVHLDDV